MEAGNPTASIFISGIQFLPHAVHRSRRQLDAGIDDISHGKEKTQILERTVHHFLPALHDEFRVRVHIERSWLELLLVDRVFDLELVAPTVPEDEVSPFEVAPVPPVLDPDPMISHEAGEGKRKGILMPDPVFGRHRVVFIIPRIGGEIESQNASQGRTEILGMKIFQAMAVVPFAHFPHERDSIMSGGTEVEFGVPEELFGKAEIGIVLLPKRSIGALQERPFRELLPLNKNG